MGYDRSDAEFSDQLRGVRPVTGAAGNALKSTGSLGNIEWALMSDGLHKPLTYTAPLAAVRVFLRTMPKLREIWVAPAVYRALLDASTHVENVRLYDHPDDGVYLLVRNYPDRWVVIESTAGPELDATVYVDATSEISQGMIDMITSSFSGSSYFVGGDQPMSYDLSDTEFSRRMLGAPDPARARYCGLFHIDHSRQYGDRLAGVDAIVISRDHLRDLATRLHRLTYRDVYVSTAMYRAITHSVVAFHTLVSASTGEARYYTCGQFGVLSRHDEADYTSLAHTSMDLSRINIHRIADTDPGRPDNDALLYVLIPDET